jgi:hypothetical protein
MDESKVIEEIIKLRTEVIILEAVRLVSLLGILFTAVYIAIKGRVS